MPYKIKGKCIYKKDTGKKVGCTKGSVKKYMGALMANVKDSFEVMPTFKDFYPLWEQKCWKGYYKAGMKKKGGKMVNDCRPIKKKLTESFITETYKMFGHDEALKALFPNIIAGKQGLAALQSAMKHGMIRVAKMGNDFGLTYHPMYASNAAKKTAKDIAAFYNMGVKDDFEGL